MFIFNGLITLMEYIFIRESYTSVVLRRKAKSRDELSSGVDGMLNIQFWQELLPQLSASFIRPFQLLIRRPIIQIITCIFGVSFGIYGQAVSVSALHYIPIAIGATAASQIGGRIMDWVYQRLSNKNNSSGRPEFRVPYSMGGAILMPIGLFWYGWVAEVPGPWQWLILAQLCLHWGTWCSVKDFLLTNCTSLVNMEHQRMRRREWVQTLWHLSYLYMALSFVIIWELVTHNHGSRSLGKSSKLFGTIELPIPVPLMNHLRNRYDIELTS
ncbi:hypothetical protein OCU04_006509 [Sclerotinia nivalis]|uniref:Uncharacterized protein n=1 Tax=Sclerotinia nivalis TaxID=352851 RepID=A0A9X0DHX2_9HELO|nr:hypothetical protein OCU04_006509 [Sclerotinia nivalis]